LVDWDPAVVELEEERGEDPRVVADDFGDVVEEGLDRPLVPPLGGIVPVWRTTDGGTRGPGPSSEVA
jgi:hypothetical protein